MASTLARRFALQIANKFGYEIVPTWRMKNKPMADLLTKIFEHNRIQCVFDVGANRGQYAEFLRLDVGFTGRIVSFEPIASNVEYLQEKARSDPNWSIYGFALGRAKGIANFNVMELDVFSSFLTPSHAQINAFEHLNNVKEIIPVEVKRLDDAVIEFGFDLVQTPTFLKLDTQGFDLEVIAGAMASLSQLRGLQSEISSVPIYEGMPDMLTSLETMRKYGFCLAGMYPVSTAKNLSAIEFDAVFINAGLAE